MVQLPPVSDEHIAALQHQVQTLQHENHQLRTELEQSQARVELAVKAKAELVVGGARLLVPLLDRNKVARSFGQLVQTAGNFAGPREQWPTRDQLVGEARTFLESCARFAIRRRTVFWVFSLLAATIPAIQVWLVVQQNEIIENQNKFFEIQVYDVVARSMTEGDRNAKLMTGALLANAELGFLRGVIEEAFESEVAGTYRPEAVHAATRRLEDAAFRGHLVRSVVRGVETRSGEVDHRALMDEAQPMLDRILSDAAHRMPQVLRLAKPDTEIDGALAEQVDHYLVQIGGAMRIYGRLARSTGEEAAYTEALRPLLRRLADQASTTDSQFHGAYVVALQDLLIEVALQPKLGDPAIDLSSGDTTPQQAYAQGIERLSATLGADAVNWDGLTATVATP